MNVSNSSAVISWPEPPSSFLNGSTVEKYLLIGGKDPTQIFNPVWLPAEPRQYDLTRLQARTNYIGKIIAVLSDGRRGSTDWIRFQTKEGSKCRICWKIFVRSTFHIFYVLYSTLQRE